MSSDSSPKNETTERGASLAPPAAARLSSIGVLALGSVAALLTVVVHLYLLSQRQQAALLAASLSGGGGASSGINGEAEACAVCPAVECPSVELIECPVVERAECPEFEPVQPAEWKQPECPTFPPQDASGQASFDGWVLPRLFRGDDPIVYTSAPYDLKEVPFVVFAWSTGHFWENGYSFEPIVLSDETLIRTAGWHKVALVLSKWFVKPELPLLANKAMAFHRFVTTVARQDPKIVIACVDAADVAVSSSPSVILGKFRRMNADIVVSAELNLYPDVERKVASFFDELAPEGSRYKYVNSGTVIGYAGALEAMYARLLDDDLKYLRPESPERSHECCDDQRGVTTYVRYHSDDPPMYGGKRHVVLDYGLELAAPMFMTEFNPVHGARDYECTKEAATWEVVCKVKSTGTTPSFWHGNGSSKYTFAYLMFEMGYLEPPEVQLLKEAGEAGALLTGKDGMLTMPGDPRVDETVPACEAASGESGGAGAQ